MSVSIGLDDGVYFGHKVLCEFLKFGVGGEEVLDQRHALLFVVGQSRIELLEQLVGAIVGRVGAVVVVILLEIIDCSRS